MIFEDSIKRSDLSVIEDLSFPGRPLIIAFGGMAGNLGLPPFEFFNLTNDLDVNKIYLRDLEQTWYHSGISGISHNIDGTASYLQRSIKDSGADQVVVVGNSMGGYAALIFGILIKADVIHAFSPHTSLKNPKLVRKKSKLLHVHINYSKKYFDVKRIIKSHKGLGVFNIYFDSRNEIDAKHAKHLKRIKNVTLHTYNEGMHNIVRVLRDSGELRNIIISSLNDVPTKVS